MTSLDISDSAWFIQNDGYTVIHVLCINYTYETWKQFIWTDLKMAFDAFDHDKKGVISTTMIGTILGMLGHEVTQEQLTEIISEVDIFGK